MSRSKTSSFNLDNVLFEKYLKIWFSVLLYWIVSICMVFLNKSLLQTDSTLNAPVFIIWFQCLQIIFFCWICSLLGKRFPEKFPFPSVQFNINLLKDTFPLSVIFCGMVIFNNLCLQEVGVAFYTVARSLVTIFSLVFGFIVLHERPSPMSCICCFVILLGFLLGVYQETESSDGLSVKGVLYGIVASVFVSLNAIFITRTLPVVDNSKWKLLFYSNFNAVVLLMPPVVLHELRDVLSSQPSPWLWLRLCFSGVFAFAMGYVVALQIQVTSPLTHTISGVAKACLQTVLAVVYFQENKTALWWLSNFLVLAGTSSYSLVKTFKMKQDYDVKQASHNPGELDFDTAQKKKS